ncbi:MAG: type I-E CRISPR-associated protein Cse2/CasB [Anaerolineaceae bacterium]|nr:type I-E CRISPR-associated protein Cse2/CasB [Anaerolineaceae bacterium]
MNRREPSENAKLFIEKLKKLTAGEKARLKRNAGNKIAESREVMGLFYRLLPEGTPAYDHETFFLVATLFPMIDVTETGSFASSMSKAKNKKNEKGLDKRFEILLDSDSEQIGFRIRQAVHYLSSQKIRIHWVSLLDDLTHWTHPDRYIQQEWAREYFRKSI